MPKMREGRSKALGLLAALWGISPAFTLGVVLHMNKDYDAVEASSSVSNTAKSEEEEQEAATLSKRFEDVEKRIFTLYGKLSDVEGNSTIADYSLGRFRDGIVSAEKSAHALNINAFLNERRGDALSDVFADSDSSADNARSKLSEDLENAKKLAKETERLQGVMDKELSEDHKNRVEAEEKVVKLLSDPSSKVSVDAFEGRLHSLQERTAKIDAELSGQARKGVARTSYGMIDDVRSQIRRLGHTAQTEKQTLTDGYF